MAPDSILVWSVFVIALVQVIQLLLGFRGRLP